MAKVKRATSRVEGSEEKIVGNALFFYQGLDAELQVFDLKRAIDNVKALPAEAQLEHLRRLADTERSPRLQIITREGGGEEEQRVHNPVKLEPIGTVPGRYRFRVPDIFKRDGALRYAVMDTIHYERSYTKDQHDRWDDFQEEHKLKENLAEQSRIRRDIRSKIPSDETIRSMQQQLPELRDAQEKLAKRQGEMYIDLDIPKEKIDEVEARIDLLTARIKGIEEQLAKWGNTNDPFKQALEASPLQKELQTLTDKTNTAFLHYVWMLSSEADPDTEAHTKLTWEDWQREATAEDYANAVRLVSQGNEFWAYGKGATPLSRDQERAKQMDRSLN